ncbi:MAG: class I SAM-dependent methyltransferase [Actinomycetota bacterium]|nr:class I SAM-dependent methyltransferase [Actinomycetota bacterium]
MRAIHDAAAVGFERGAAEYERGRPGYPAEAVQTLVRALAIGPGVRVLDLAAGTGKLTRELVAGGADVVAVEPVDAMRATLAGALPGVEVLSGTAERLPLGPDSVEAVTAAQAFHWFDGDRALAEIHRVLRGRGRLALVWNKRDESDPLQARISEVIEPYRGRAPSHASLAWRAAFERTPLFGPLAEWHGSWVHTTDADGLVARAASISFIAALPPDKRDEVLARVRGLVAPAEPVRLAYRTHVYWCERRPTSAA